MKGGILASDGAGGAAGAVPVPGDGGSDLGPPSPPSLFALVRVWEAASLTLAQALREAGLPRVDVLEGSWDVDAQDIRRALVASGLPADILGEP